MQLEELLDHGDLVITHYLLLSLTCSSVDFLFSIQKPLWVASRVLWSIVWPADTEQGFLPPGAAAAVGVSSVYISLKTSQLPLDEGPRGRGSAMSRGYTRKPGVGRLSFPRPQPRLGSAYPGKCHMSAKRRPEGEPRLAVHTEPAGARAWAPTPGTQWLS